MRLIVFLALMIVMIMSLLTIMTLFFHSDDFEEGQQVIHMQEKDGTKRLYSALALLLVTSPFMFMGINQLSKGQSQTVASPSKIKAEAVGMMTLTFGSPFFITNLVLCITGNPLILVFTFVLSWWGMWILFGETIRSKLSE